MLQRLLLAAAAIVASLPLSCAQPGSDGRELARVNGEAITVGEFRSNAPALTKDTVTSVAARRRFLEQMIGQKLLVQHARALGYDETLAGAREKKAAELLRRHLELRARNQKVTPRDLALESTLVVNQVHLRVIEVSTWDTAQVVEMLIQQGVPFESLVVRYNRAPFAPPDGDLGFAPISRTPPEVQRVLDRLQPGQASGLIIRGGVFYDFVQLVARRTVPFDSVAAMRSQFEALARQRKVDGLLGEIRAQVSFDEAALDYFTRRGDSLLPGDADRVIARRRDGYKVRMGALLPLLRSYPVVYAHLKRRALKEDILNDVIEQEARRRGIDRTREYQAELRQQTDAGIYQYFYSRQIVEPAVPSDTEIGNYARAHPEKYAGRQIESQAGDIRNQLAGERRQQRHDRLLQELRAKASIRINEALLAR
jgi:parvulin-like peptidyl-prolyl isomerase